MKGDTDVLELMQMGEIKTEQDVREYLGEDFVEKRDFFVETGNMIKDKKTKYEDMHRRRREDKKHYPMYDYK